MNTNASPRTTDELIAQADKLRDMAALAAKAKYLRPLKDFAMAVEGLKGEVNFVEDGDPDNLYECQWTLTGASLSDVHVVWRVLGWSPEDGDAPLRSFKVGPDTYYASGSTLLFLRDLADALTAAGEGEFFNLRFRLEDFRRRFVTPIVTALEAAGYKGG